MKFLKSILIWVFGFICGSLLIFFIIDSKNSFAEISFKNNSNFLIKSISIQEDKYNNTYFIEHLKPNQQKKIFLFTNGEIGYQIVVELENGDTLSTGGYAETGYKDLYIIKNDSLIYNPFTLY